MRVKKNRLNRWTHTKKYRNTSKVSLLYLFYRKKVKKMIFSVRRPQYFISHTKTQRLLVRRHRLSCEKVNLHNTLVPWAWDACVISEQYDSRRKNTAKPFVTTMFKKIFRPAKLHLPLNRSFWKRTEHRKVKWMITTKPSSNNPVTFVIQIFLPTSSFCPVMKGDFSLEARGP